MKITSIILSVVIVLSVFASAGWGQTGKLEKTKIVIAVGGQQGLIYLPLSVAWKLGYFKEAGIDLDMQNLAGGGQALRALIGGSADMVSGFYDHTIQMQAQGKTIKAVAMQQRYPGLVLLVSKHARDKGVKALADLKGKKIGVTALGSSSHFFVNYLMTGAGVNPDDFSVIGVGLGSTAVAAIQNNQIDAVSALEPSVTTVHSSGDAPLILADTRTTKGTNQIFGGGYPAGSIYVRDEFIKQNPNTVQAVVTAMIRALRWMQAQKLDDIVSLMPQEYYQGSRQLYTQALKSMMDSFSPDGRILVKDAQNVAKVLSFDPAVKKTNININDTFDMQFVEAYWKSQKK